MAKSSSTNKATSSKRNLVPDAHNVVKSSSKKLKAPTKTPSLTSSSANSSTSFRDQLKERAARLAAESRSDTSVARKLVLEFDARSTQVPARDNIQTHNDSRNIATSNDNKRGIAKSNYIVKELIDLSTIDADSGADVIEIGSVLQKNDGDKLSDCKILHMTSVKLSEIVPKAGKKKIKKELVKKKEIEVESLASSSEDMLSSPGGGDEDHDDEDSSSASSTASPYAKFPTDFVSYHQLVNTNMERAKRFVFPPDQSAFQELDHWEEAADDASIESPKQKKELEEIREAQRKQFPERYIPVGCSYLLHNGKPFCFDRSGLTSMETIASSSRSQLCFGCSKNKFNCHELLYGRYCVQAVYWYMKYHYKGTNSKEGMRQVFFDAYNRIRHVCEWLRSPKDSRTYQPNNLDLEPPACVMAHSFERCLVIYERMKDRLSSSDPKNDIVLNLYQTHDDWEILPKKEY